MALADYYSRAALAAAQILAGFDEPRIRMALDKAKVGITIGSDAVETKEGIAIADLLVRLFARLYPTIVINVEGTKGEALKNILIGLAQQINPNIDIGSKPTIDLAIGKSLIPTIDAKRIFLGSSGWNAFLSDSVPQSVGNSSIPFGPGIAACFGAANIFRSVFLGREANLDRSINFSALIGDAIISNNLELNGSLGEIALIGAGAIGNAAVWALSRIQMEGTIHIVDHQTIDVGNLQRYIMAERKRESAVKVEMLANCFKNELKAIPHQRTFAEFTHLNGYKWEKMLLALDSSFDRRSAQASLPQWVANAWTQPGDLGVSTHNFLDGACVTCLYLPEHALENEDELVASTLNLPDKLMEIRTLLYTGAGLSNEFLNLVGTARNIPFDRLLPFLGQPLRILYTEGFCGGALIPLGEAELPRKEVHVPLAHQSALSGVLLAAAAVKQSLKYIQKGTCVTRINVMAPLGSFLTQPAAKDSRDICICCDTDYINVYKNKYAI